MYQHLQRKGLQHFPCADLHSNGITRSYLLFSTLDIPLTSSAYNTRPNRFCYLLIYPSATLDHSPIYLAHPVRYHIQAPKKFMKNIPQQAGKPTTKLRSCRYLSSHKFRCVFLHCSAMSAVASLLFPPVTTHFDQAMTLTFILDLDRVKVNQHAKYIRSNVIYFKRCRLDAHTHT